MAGRLDLGRIGVAGHSFGAHTALAVAGMLLVGPDGRELSLADSRVKAAIIMSPPAPRRPGLAGAIYAPIHIPCLHLTGTRDESPLGLTAVADLRGRSHDVRRPSPARPLPAGFAPFSRLDPGQFHGLLGRLFEGR